MKKLLAVVACLPMTAFAHNTGFIHSHVNGPLSASSIALALVLFCVLYKKL